MKIGVNILNFGPGARPDTLLRWAQVAEALGFHSVWISDHVAITPRVAERYPEPYWDTFVTLAWLAGQTRRVQLGNTVAVLPLRDPILTARMAANVDQMSGGRFIFGVGVGGIEEEFAAVGAPFRRRGRLTDESLAAIRALWAGEGLVSYEGRLVRFRDVQAIKTRQQPRPPIWVGGWTESALRRAVTYGDGWHPILIGPVETAREGLEKMQAMAETAGTSTPLFVPRIRLDLRDAPLGVDRRPGSGSLDQVRSDLQALERMGAVHVVLDWFTGDLEATRDHERGWRMLALIAEKVADLGAEALR